MEGIGEMEWERHGKNIILNHKKLFKLIFSFNESPLSFEKLLLSSPFILFFFFLVFYFFNFKIFNSYMRSVFLSSSPPWSGNEIVYVSFLVEANSIYLFIQEIIDCPYGFIFPLGVAHSSEN